MPATTRPTRSTREKPNILITGTPGTGKTTMAELISLGSDLSHLNVSQLILSRKYVSEWDEELESWVLDEDALVDALKDDVKNGGLILDYHGVDFFPKDWFDLVIVTTTDNSILYSRLEHRNYSSLKIQENVTAEIMQVILQEASQHFQGLVVQVQSNSLLDMDKNCEKVLEWIQNWDKKEDFIQDPF